MTSLIIGKGETGTALYNILSEHYPEDTFAFDIKDEDFPKTEKDIDILHICIPYSDDFVNIVGNYQELYQPKYTIIHSSVKVGTSAKIKGKVFHSPIRGVHPDMEKDILTYIKYISFHTEDYTDYPVLMSYFSKAGIKTSPVYHLETTELMKLLELCRYGVYIAFAKEQEKICKHFGLDYDTVVTEYEKTRNEGITKLGRPELCQPLLYPFANYVGGHCTVEDMELLLSQAPMLQLLATAYIIDKGTTVWGNCNIYPTAKIGKGCSIGFGTEIGKDVKIGNNVRIGAMCFLPEGVTIEDDVFIAPKVTCSNDKHPPSDKNHWGKVLIKKGAVIGMNSTILPGVTIGENAVIGAGCVVTKDVPAGELWYGSRAYPHGTREETYKKLQNTLDKIKELE